MEKYHDYLTSIERFFAVARCSGFVLSPRDQEWVRQWYQKGYPLRLVFEGIAEGILTHRHHAPRGALPPHHLNYYRKVIEGKIRQFQRDPMHGLTGATPVAQVDDEALEAVAHFLAEGRLLALQETRELERQIKETRAQGIEVLQRLVQQGEVDLEGLWLRLQNLDDEILSLYDSGLDSKTRQWLETQLAEQLSLEPELGHRALAGRKQTLRRGILREGLGLPQWNE